MLILSGINTYSGATIINNGTLAVIGTGLITNTPNISIASGATLDVSGRAGGSMTLVSGQTLQGNGTVQGSLILANGSTLSPGGSSVGTLMFLNDLVVSNAAVLRYDLGSNSDLTVVSSNLTLGGILNINAAGGFTTGVYTLVTYGGTLTYNGVAIGGSVYNGVMIGSAPAGYTGAIDTNTLGQVRVNVAPASTITVGAADLQDRFGNLMPTNAVAVLVVDTGTNGFVNPQPSFPLRLGATWGTENQVIGLWDLRDSYLDFGQPGGLYEQTVVAYANGIAPGQKLELYWFPSLTIASNTLGVTYYGKYTDTNSPPLDGSGVWQTPAAGSSVEVDFVTANETGSNPQTAGQAVLFTPIPSVASFTASPTSGIEPLLVTFTDTSMGTITNRFWDFGDTGTTNITTNSVVHTYAAGTYNVTLIVSSPGGATTNTKASYITALTPFQAWQVLYFGSTTNPAAAATADPDGDGQDNLAEFLSGTNPTNSASSLHIISVTTQGSDVLVTWATAGGETNVVQTTPGLPGSSYSTNFLDLSPLIIITGSGDAVTNYLDGGGATNIPSRYYRVRLVP
jgi:PKD repeat protein